ncbi:MAG: DUF6066 family protein [Myxococcota bacterium]
MSSSPWVALALAVTAVPYAGQRSDAEPIKNLGRFLEEYLGDCLSEDPAFDKRSCEANADMVRRGRSGKLYVLSVEDPADRLQFNGWDAKRNAYRMLLTPFLSDRNLGLTAGKPGSFTKDGQPVLKNMPIWVPVPKGADQTALERELKRGMVRLELLFRPGKPWAFERKGDTPVRGMAVDLAGIRVYSRSDQVLAEQTY